MSNIVLLIIVICLIICYNYDNFHKLPFMKTTTKCNQQPKLKLHHETISDKKDADSYNKNLAKIQNEEYDYTKYDTNKAKALDWVGNEIEKQNDIEEVIEDINNYPGKILNNNSHSLNSHNVLILNKDISIRYVAN